MAKIFLPLVIIRFLFFATPTQAATIQPVSPQITVSAAIGEPKLTLFGWTSPKALVELSGRQLAEQVIADEKGYFFFDRVFLPRANPDYPESCLSAIDTQSRISFPTCLAPLPGGPFNFNIGPVLLPPTLSLTKGDFLPGESAIALGATLPNAPVNIFLANESAAKPIVGQALAYFLPQYQIRSDQNGHFEFNLPDQHREWRLFASAQFQNFATPKSNTLTFRVLSPWGRFWQQITRLGGVILALASPYLWLLILALEIAVIIGLTRGKQRPPSGIKADRQLGLAKSILPLEYRPPQKQLGPVRRSATERQ